MITVLLLLIVKCLALLSLRGLPSRCDTPRVRQKEGAGDA
jgi:hypothetical protein